MFYLGILTLIFGISAVVMYMYNYNYKEIVKEIVKKIFIKLFGIVMFIWKLKIDFSRRFYKKKDKMFKKDSTVIDDLVYVFYDVTHNEKDLDIVFVSDSNSGLYNDITTFKKDINTYISKRHWFVHASITDKNSDILFDVTDDLRKFCYYFGTRFKLDLFYKWFQCRVVNKTNIRLDIYDYSLTLFMNDDNFSEHVIKIDSAKDFQSILLE